MVKIPALEWGRQFNPACFVGNIIPRVFVTRDHATSSMNVAHVEVSIPTQHVLELELRGRTKALKVGKNSAMVGVCLEKGPSPIRVEILESWLIYYPNREDAKYLLEGFKYGFRIPAFGGTHCIHCVESPISAGNGRHSTK